MQTITELTTTAIKQNAPAVFSVKNGRVVINNSDCEVTSAGKDYNSKDAGTATINVNGKEALLAIADSFEVLSALIGATKKGAKLAKFEDLNDIAQSKSDKSNSFGKFFDIDGVTYCYVY